MAHRRPRGERGSAVTEFVLVAPLLMLVFLGLIQVAMVLYAHDVLVADAAEGARDAANQGVGTAAGDRRCAQFIRQSLSPSLARAASCSSSLEQGPDGLLEVRTEVRAVIPFAVLPVGELHVRVLAHALAEPAAPTGQAAP